MATRAELTAYLANFSSGYPVWASRPTSDRTTPTSTKVQEGWQIEQPTHSLFNWYQNRTDTRLDQLEGRVSFLENAILTP